MNTNNLNTALYEKMATEQEKYRDWLKSQPRKKSCTTPKNILSVRIL